MSSQLALLDVPPTAPAPPTRREDLDFWPTPDWLARALARLIGFSLSLRILDAGAGEGALGVAIEQLAAVRGQALPQITAVELHPGRAAELRRRHPTWEVIEADFFAWAAKTQTTRDAKGRVVRRGRSWPVVVSNPPQAIAGQHVWVPWVTAGASLADPDGGRIHALGHDLLWTTPARAAWWRANPPLWYRPSPRRPSFSGDGGTDGRVWGWWEWHRGPMPQMCPTRCELLEVEW